MRETKLTAIILKKQPFKEGDEIITLFTKEHGKVRVLAKSVKSSKSKLQQRLQALFLVDVIVTQGSFPKIIGAETLQVYHHLRENLPAMKMAFYAVELVLKFTADEQKNEPLFNLLCDFLQFLDLEENQAILDLGLAKFKMEILEVSGLGMQENKNGLFMKLKQVRFEDLNFILNSAGDQKRDSSTFAKASADKSDALGMETTRDLQATLSEFIEYQLERKVKSENYLNMV